MARPILRPLLVATLLAAVPLSAVPAAAVGAVEAHAAPAAAPSPVPDQGLSGVASSQYQTNDEVWALVPGGGRLYAGGRFTTVRAPGATTGTARTRLAAFSTATGAVTGFRVTLNGSVRALALSADNSTLYLGGDFTTVNGVSRQRLAAVSTATGALRTGFRADAGARVTALHLQGGTLYVGGEFTTVGGRAKARLAALDAATGAVRAGFTADLDRKASTLALDTSLNRLLVGGAFDTVNGVSSPGIAAVDATTGAVQPFAAAGAGSCVHEVRSIVVDQAADVAYATSLADQPGCFEGVYRADVATGRLHWLDECAGAGQALVLLRGWLYFASHTHDCGRMTGGFTGGRFREDFSWYRLNALEPQTGRFGHWQPNTNGAGTTVVGPQALATDGTQLFVGGDFTTVNGGRQQGLTRFTPKGADAAPAVPGTPAVDPTAAGTVTVTVPGTWDRDNGVLGYELQRDVPVPTTVGTASAESWAFSMPVLRFTDSATAGTTVRYRVRARGGTATSGWSAWSDPVTVPAADPTPAADAVLGTSPDVFWRLADPGTAQLDATGQGRSATASSGAAGDPDGLLAADPAVRLDGASGQVVEDVARPLSPAWTVSMWFRTTTRTGGALAAVSAAVDGSGTPTDRVLWMDNDGAVVTALRSELANGRPGRPGRPVFTLVRSPRTYADGRWHHVVAGHDGSTLRLYLDGRLVGSAAATATPVLDQGHLRVGAADLSTFYSVFGVNATGTQAPASHALAGSVDEVAAWSGTLTDAQVAQLWRSGMSGR